MKIENTLDYCVEVYDIINILRLKKKDNIFQELMNHIKYITGSDRIIYMRLLPEEVRGTYYTLGFGDDISDMMELIKEVLIHSKGNERIYYIELDGKILNILRVPYDGDSVGVFAFFTDLKLELTNSFFEAEYQEHTSEMLTLQGALYFFLKIAGIMLKKYEFTEKNEMFLISEEQLIRLDNLRRDALQNIFAIACQIYHLNHPGRSMTEAEFNLEWSEIKRDIDTRMKELRDDLCHFTWQRKKFYTSIKKVQNPGSLYVLVNKFYQLPEDYIPEDLEKIDEKFNPSGLVLRHEARVAFETMCKQALQEGIKLEAISTFRSFEYQHKVYYKNLLPDMKLEEYQAIRDKVSARAGHSEHQTGLAVDINDLEQTFEDTKEGKWLAKNSHRFGFILRYPKGMEHITGYDYEPWHFRYLGHQLAEDVYHSSLTYDEYYHKFISPLKDYE